MKRLMLLFGFYCCLLSGTMLAQTSANPFEILARLPKTGVVLAGSEAGSQRSNNPFDVVPHRAPNISTALIENKTEPFRPFSLFPKGGGFSQSTLLWILMGMFGFLSFSIAANRSGVGKAWRSFLNDNGLTLAQREATGLAGSTPYYLLYANFLLNAGMFIFLVMRFFNGETFNNLRFLFFCWGAALIMFLSKHILVRMVSWLFSIDQEARRYNFLITTFNCVLGLFLVPFNLLLAFSGKYEAFLVFWTLGLITIFYGYRSLRSASVSSKFLATDQFHFLLYLCTIEIAPVMLLIKLAMIQAN